MGGDCQSAGGPLALCPQTVGETGRTLSGGQVKSTKNFLKIAVFLAGEWEEVTSCTKETLLWGKELDNGANRRNINHCKDLRGNIGQTQ